jgi:hypothetical protein
MIPLKTSKFSLTIPVTGSRQPSGSGDLPLNKEELIKEIRGEILFELGAAGQAPYNPLIIAALKNYNYEGFQATARVDAAVFAEVKMYLLNGDIRGVYGKILADTANLITLLKKVKASVDAEEFPSYTESGALTRRFPIPCYSAHTCLVCSTNCND